MRCMFAFVPVPLPAVPMVAETVVDPVVSFLYQNSLLSASALLAPAPV